MSNREIRNRVVEACGLLENAAAATMPWGAAVVYVEGGVVLGVLKVTQNDGHACHHCELSDWERGIVINDDQGTAYICGGCLARFCGTVLFP